MPHSRPLLCQRHGIRRLLISKLNCCKKPPSWRVAHAIDNEIWWSAGSTDHLDNSAPSHTCYSMLRTSAIIVLAFLLAVHEPCQAQFVVETNSMRIREPESLAGEADIAIGDVSLLAHTQPSVQQRRQHMCCVEPHAFDTGYAQCSAFGNAACCCKVHCIHLQALLGRPDTYTRCCIAISISK